MNTPFDAAIEDSNDRDIDYYKEANFDKVIQGCTLLIILNPEYAVAYYNRGIAYRNIGDFDASIADFSKAITLNPYDANAYYLRGNVWLNLIEWEKAKADLTIARDMGIDIVGFFDAGCGVEGFEAWYEVKMPEDIAALLRRG